MYYPYLRGRQNELIALRNFAENLRGTSHLFPIIEPVRLNMNTLLRAVSALSVKGVPYGIILNPECGEWAGRIINPSVMSGFPSEGMFSPTFIVSGDSVPYIRSEVESYGYTNLSLIITPGVTLDEKSFEELVKEPFVSRVILDVSRRGFVKVARDAHKAVIRLDDKFIARQTNAEYVEIEEELFTQEPFYYSSDHYDGFSDYTVLPNEFKEGGSLPKVVAIHLSYQHAHDEIYVRHFCSYSDPDMQVNVQGKFKEAGESAVAYFNRIGQTDCALEDLNGYIRTNHFPGLGTLKKLSVLHHLLLMQRVLSD